MGAFLTKRNDQAHVEQKSWPMVRRVAGYDRYEGGIAKGDLNALYRDVPLYVNSVQPSVKVE